MKIPQRVVWTEGMFMSPQHLQSQDQYHEALVDARVAALAPYDWGVLAVEIDRRALAAGQIRLQKFSGVLPDGVPISFDDKSTETPAARGIENNFSPKDRALEVFLAIPFERDGIPNYSEGTAPQPIRTRFVISGRPISDGTTGTAEVNVAFAQRNVQIMFGNESRENFSAMKVAEIVRDPSGALVIREDYIPPSLKNSASPYVMDQMKRLLGLMVAKQRSVAEGRRQRKDSTVEFTGGDVTQFLLLNAINTYIPVLTHLIDNSDTSTIDTYLMLSQFAGMLCTFTVDADPSTLPKFIYNDLSLTFPPLIERITGLLNQNLRERYITVPLSSREDGLHFGRLEDERLVRTNVYVLTVSPLNQQLNEKMIAEQLPRLSKIASFQVITQIVNSALPGVVLQVNYRPPPEIPVKANTVYFDLKVGDDFWRAVLNERAIAMYLPPPFSPNNIKIELLAVPPAQTGPQQGR